MTLHGPEKPAAPTHGGYKGNAHSGGTLSAQEDSGEARVEVNGAVAA